MHKKCHCYEGAFHFSLQNVSGGNSQRQTRPKIYGTKDEPQPTIEFIMEKKWRRRQDANTSRSKNDEEKEDVIDYVVSRYVLQSFIVYCFME